MVGIVPHQYQRSIFEIIVRDSIDLVVSDGEAIVSKVQYTYVCTIFEFFLPPPLVFLNLVLILKYTTVCLLGWTPLTPSPTHTLRTSYVFLPQGQEGCRRQRLPLRHVRLLRDPPPGGRQVARRPHPRRLRACSAVQVQRHDRQLLRSRFYGPRAVRGGNKVGRFAL